MMYVFSKIVDAFFTILSLHNIIFNVHVSNQQPFQGNLGFFYHVPQNS